VLTPEELDRVRGALYLSGLRHEDLDDAAQEVQLRLLERAPDGLRSRVAWACTVAVNLARDWHRRAGRRRAAEEVLLRTAPAHRQDPDVALAAALADGLGRLDPEHRAVLVLRFYADLPVGDIARFLGVPEGTVKSRLHRATSAMRDLLPRETVT
jgi:RNA polymerase sigma-70 factor (ECF subfamily)